MEYIDDPATKTLAILSNLATKQNKSKAKIEHASETILKGTLQSLSAILLECGGDPAKVLLDTIAEQFFYLLVEISETPDSRALIDKILPIFDPKNRKKAFSVARTTVDSVIPSMTRAQMDKELEIQYQTNIADLEKINARSDRIAVALDDTHIQADFKQQNGNCGYVSIGQQNSWKKGMIFPSQYDLTHQQYLGCHQQDYRETFAKSKSCSHLITEIQQKSHLVRTTGSSVAVFEADRGYFIGELFAAASLNMLDLEATQNEAPRLIVPRKFTREKESFKWDFLLNPNSKPVFIESIMVPKKSPLIKKKSFSKIAQIDKDGNYTIPYCCVALIDEYGCKTPRNFEEISKEARALEIQFQNNKSERSNTEQEYLENLKPFFSKKTLLKCPSYGRGKKRTKFNNSKDYELYWKCWKLYEQGEKLKEKKTALTKVVMFFAISLNPNEDPLQNPQKYIAFAHDYHQRWGIENGFRDVKQSFFRPVRSSKPTKRQFMMMFGMILYGRWHVDRITESLSIVRKRKPKKKPFNPKRQWVRRKLEQEVRNLITARSYLIMIWGKTMKMMIKKYLTL
jgi:hypothetical protein